jgi:hypothetical protein
MQTPLQTSNVQALRNTRFVEGIARGRTGPSESASAIVAPAGLKRALGRADSVVVFCGDPAQMAGGFAIALRAMGVNESKPGEDPDA